MIGHVEVFSVDYMTREEPQLNKNMLDVRSSVNPLDPTESGRGRSYMYQLNANELLMPHHTHSLSPTREAGLTNAASGFAVSIPGELADGENMSPTG